MKVKNLFKLMMVSAVIVPALIISVFGSIFYSSFFSAMVGEETASSAYTASMKAVEYFKKYQSALSVLSRLDFVIKAVGGDYATNSETIDAMLKQETDGDDGVLDICILDNSGIVVASSNESSVKKTFFAYDDELIATPAESSFISHIFVNNDTYFASVIAAVKPVVSETGSTGYIAYVLAAEKLSDMLLSSAVLNDGNSLTMIDSAGNALNLSGNKVTQYTDTASSPFLDAINQIKVSSVSTDTKYTALNAGGYYGAYGMLSGTSWGWIGAVPSSYVSGRVTSPILVGLIVFLICALVDAFVAFTVYKKSISPIGKVVSSIREIGAGDRDKRLPIAGSYEFDVISEIFNSTLEDSFLSEEIHRTICNLSENMLFEWDLEEGRMYVSDNFRSAFKIDVEKTTLLDGKFLDSLMSDTDGLKFRRELSALLNQKRDICEGEYRVKARDGSDLWISVRAKTVTNRLGDVLRVIGVVTNINSEKKTQINLSQRASFDFLSQLYNRSTFLRELQNHVDLKSASEHISILFVDVDDFKFINDRYGHNVGDEVIKFVSDVLKKQIGENGFAGRFGGDEFVICSLNPKITGTIEDFAMSVIDSLYQGYKCDAVSGVLNVRASIGISIYPNHGKTANELVGSADEAMYFVKKNGKSNYHIFEESDAADIDQSNTIV